MLTHLISTINFQILCFGICKINLTHSTTIRYDCKAWFLNQLKSDRVRCKFCYRYFKNPGFGIENQEQKVIEIANIGHDITGMDNGWYNPV